MRRGFTLIEMLVASGVFLTGFVAIYAVLLRGAHDRSRSEAMTRTSLGLTSLAVELRLAIAEADGGQPASDYVGYDIASATLPVSESASESSNGKLTPLAGMPGVWYRVADATDLTGSSSATSGALALDVVAIYAPTPTPTLDLATMSLRAGTDPTWSADPAGALDALVARGVIQRQTTIVARRATWTP